ncbi:branched-chain amino acid ABC transporter substrate binding protein precursor [Alkalidesulfovibrio alkalitolerans DSM 16529]|jgi:branched-chain amino acid transport system substrate-binding protein|uniref:Branched-chain amino acid ABC transporter substrate binding protein n=1 Tax=Alkalidesulfovibrio alkalitolerans DSM 16529 TaxID=1121439 RepID=S7T368_9BACT|nr:branched-chain amino acid ABC transporter substrate-binding protein [Alkalidesulfovibrio alkalitolerans]EPR31036.1 branched-chain amino acid ABC transporter substrate binding protein precursor [Alkalidesulfovibrio alkalitolerans DSM 16529]
MNRNVVRILVVAMALVLASGPALAAKLKIGSLSPLTGPYAADGNDIANGVRAAIAAIEKEGGIPGFDGIELMAEDSACDPKQAVAAANKLLSAKVAGVIGAYCSSATIPASDVLSEDDIPMLTPASTNEKVTERGLKHMYRVCGRDDDQSVVAVQFMTDYLKGKSVYIVDDKTTYSQGLADNVKKLAAEKGLKVIAHDHVNQGDRDFSAVLTKIKAANPDVFYMSLQNSSSGALMLIQARRMGINAAIIGQDAVYHPQLMEIAKADAEGVFLTFGFIDESTEAYQKFLAAYAPYGTPGAYSGYAYDSATVLLKAIKDAGSTKPDDIRAAIMKMDFQGASKHIKFMENGDSGSNYIIRMVKDGQFVNYWNPATGQTY